VLPLQIEVDSTCHGLEPILLQTGIDFQINGFLRGQNPQPWRRAMMVASAGMAAWHR